MIDINLPQVEAVICSTADGLYEKTGHGIDGKIQIIGVNAALSVDQLNALSNAGYVLEDRFNMERAKPNGPLLVPKTFTSYIFTVP